MKALIITSLLFLAAGAQAQTSACEASIKSAVEKWDNTITLVHYKTDDGKTYYVAYYETNGDHREQALLQVDVNPQSCQVLNIQDAE